jgi:hypothetical protein
MVEVVVAEVVVAGSSCVKQYVPFHSSLLLDSLHMQVVEPVLGDTLCKQHSNILRLVTVQASFYINFMMKHYTIFKQVSFSSTSIRLSCQQLLTGGTVSDRQYISRTVLEHVMGIYIQCAI